MVTTIAGNGAAAVVNGPAMQASFHAPLDVAVAADGTIYVADFNGHCIRKIANGAVSTFAGSGTYDIINGNGVNASFKDPYRIALDGAGNLYVVDQVDTRIRKIATNADVTTYAGSATPGFLNGIAANAEFAVNAGGLATDANGNVYLGDTFNERIRKISSNGTVSTFSGSGGEGFTDGDASSATFRWPDGITVDKDGNLYTAEQGNFGIRKIAPDGSTSKFAGGSYGTKDGNAANAQFNFIGDMVADKNGNLFVIDDNRIRMITPQGAVTTIAGSGKGYKDGDGSIALFAGPGGLGIDEQGNIYVADIMNNRLRKVSHE